MPLALLSPRESELLAHAETDIREGMAGFKKAGAALALVRDQSLYRAEFKTFEEYVAQKWGMLRCSAYRKMECAEVAKQLEDHGCVVEIEDHAAKLAAIKNPDERVRIFRQIADAGKVTAAKIEQAAKSATVTTTEPHPKAKPITDGKFERVVETEMTRIATLIDEFPDPRHLLVIDENLKFLRGRIEELMAFKA